MVGRSVNFFHVFIFLIREKGFPILFTTKDFGNLSNLTSNWLVEV